MKRFLSAKGLIGGALVAAVLLVAILAPLFIPADAATRMHMTARLKPPRLRTGWEPTSWAATF